MIDLYLYLDETGQLALNGDTYFGLGQATFRDTDVSASREGAQLRFELERNGVHLPKGFHVKNDSEATRARVFELIAQHKPRIDVTLLNKKYIPQKIVEEIESDNNRLYYWAWRRHFDYQARYVLRRYHRVFVIAASISEHRKKQQAATAAIESVLKKYQLDITLCVWDNSTAWGLQVADYGLWAVQRDLVLGYCKHLKIISPLIESVYSPWEKDGSRKDYRPAAEFRRRGRPLSTLIFNRNHGKSGVARNGAVAFQSISAEALQASQSISPKDDDDDTYPEDDAAAEDPLGTGLWGRSPWSDDEPWEDVE